MKYKKPSKLSVVKRGYLSMNNFTEKSTGEIQLVVFDLASEYYGINISDVREIMRMQSITRVPGVYSFVEGVINLRGNVLPVIDLRKRLGLKISEHTKESRIVVIDIDSSEIGVIVDAVTEVLRVPKSAIEPASSVITNTSSNYLWGIAKLPDKLIILIDPDKALSEIEEEQFSIETMIEVEKSNIKQSSNGRNKKNNNSKSEIDNKDLATIKS
jgi:purine-binding chemotaxis protein CheW